MRKFALALILLLLLTCVFISCKDENEIEVKYILPESDCFHNFFINKKKQLYICEWCGKEFSVDYATYLVFDIIRNVGDEIKCEESMLLAGGTLEYHCPSPGKINLWFYSACATVDSSGKVITKYYTFRKDPDDKYTWADTDELVAFAKKNLSYEQFKRDYGDIYDKSRNADGIDQYGINKLLKRYKIWGN